MSTLPSRSCDFRIVQFIIISEKEKLQLIWMIRIAGLKIVGDTGEGSTKKQFPGSCDGKESNRLLPSFRVYQTASVNPFRKNK